MINPNEQHREDIQQQQNLASGDALTLDKETVKDLEAQTDGSEAVQGGVGARTGILIPLMGCTQVGCTQICFTPNPS